MPTIVPVFVSSVPGVSGQGAGCVVREKPGHSHVSALVRLFLDVVEPPTRRIQQSQDKVV